MQVQRSSTTLQPDQTRVLLRYFAPGDAQRIAGIVARVREIPDGEVQPLLDATCREFSLRHRDVRKMFADRFEQVCGSTPGKAELSQSRRLLIGSYFLAEYSLESSALFNPSMVPHPDQAGVPEGALRFVLSLRATGEGHISSITFRTGIVRADGEIVMDPPEGFLSEPVQVTILFEKSLFGRKLAELGLTCEFTQRIMGMLGDSFQLEDLQGRLEADRLRLGESMTHADHKAAQRVAMVAQSNYEVRFSPEQQFSERILFPATPSQRNGMEDARFVRFVDDDGSHRYYATFTAFDGTLIVPELLETSDFLDFRFITLNGPAARNKGMAMFPRKVNGNFAMLSRQDNDSIYLMFSKNVHFWNEYTLLLKPAFPWELVQIGNCGSPIETEAGWLVLSHGVGPMREYRIGAFLLDLADPSKVLGRLREPLLAPNASEREGYVPNVVYSCGAHVHNGRLIIPYGLADHATGFATVPLAEVLAAMEPV